MLKKLMIVWLISLVFGGLLSVDSIVQAQGDPPTDPKFDVYAGIPHHASIEDPAWEVVPDETVAEGVVRGVLEDGTPFIGSLDAPLVFADFSDFTCPHCASFEPDLQTLIQEHVRTGQLRIEFHTITFVSPEFSTTAGKSALCAAEQGAFWEFHTELFEIQENQGATNFTLDKMVDLATDLGLDEERFVSCLDSTRGEETLASTDELRSAVGVVSVPTVIYRENEETEWHQFMDNNGQPLFRLSIDAMSEFVLAYNNQSTPPSEGTAPANDEYAVYAGIPYDESIQTPAWEIVPDETVADGVVRGVLEDGTPFIGSLDAPLVFADFSDFSCPHCASFEPELQMIIENYVRTGQLRIEFRPLTFVGGSYSIMATKGAICGAQQGAFWEFHTELFALQHAEGAASFTETAMLTIGEDLGLDTAALADCIQSERPQVVLDAAQNMQVENGVNATPTLIYRGNEDVEWQRFFDASGNPITRISMDGLDELIKAYNDN